MADGDIDPITLEVIKNALASVADEMALVVMRSSYSPVVRDTMDYSTALCDRPGQVRRAGPHARRPARQLPHRDAAHRRGARGRRAAPGDVFISNDPYGSGGQHLPDIFVIKPVFLDGRIEGYAATIAHHSDVGGLAPGSVAVHATEIYQEGLRMPLLKLYEAGEPNATLLAILERNTRQPVEVLGDLRAQVAACAAGERGLLEIARALRRGRDAPLRRRAAGAGRAPDARRDRAAPGRRVRASRTTSTATATRPRPSAST